jgi:hypothetical protein
MKFVSGRPFADPDAAARKLVEIASTIEPVQDGRIYIELINAPFLYQYKAAPPEYKSGLDRAIARHFFRNGNAQASPGSAGYHLAPRATSWTTYAAVRFAEA